MLELDYNGSALSRPASVAEVECCPKDHRSLVYRAEAPCPSSVNGVLAKKRKLSLSVMAIKR